MHPLSASRLNDFLGCPHQAALWLAGIKPTEEADATLELIRDKGFEHEAAVLARLEQLHGPAERIPADGSLADRARLTREAIERGATLIYQGALTKEAWLGYPDFLLRTGSAQAAGFAPEDAKLSRKAKGEYVLQLGIYAELLEALFGIPVQERHDPCRSRRSGNASIFAAPATFSSGSCAASSALLPIEARATKPLPCAACAQCDYKPRCEDEWRKADSPFFVAGLSGAQVVKLAAAGVHTLSQVGGTFTRHENRGHGRGDRRQAVSASAASARRPEERQARL